MELSIYRSEEMPTVDWISMHQIARQTRIYSSYNRNAVILLIRCFNRKKTNTLTWMTWKSENVSDERRKYAVMITLYGTINWALKAIQFFSEKNRCRRFAYTCLRWYLSSRYPCNKDFCWKNFQWRSSAGDETTFSRHKKIISCSFDRHFHTLIVFNVYGEPSRPWATVDMFIHNHKRPSSLFSYQSSCDRLRSVVTHTPSFSHDETRS